MLQVNQLIGFGVSEAVVPFAITYQGFVADNTNQTSYTYTSQPVGSGTRKIVVCIMAVGGGGGPTISSVTVDGNTMTSAVAQAGGGNENTGQYYYDATTTGSSVSIVVNLNNGVQSACHITIYTITSAVAGAPNSTVSANYSSVTAALTSNCPAGGGIIGSVVARNDTNYYTWTNLDENYDELIDGTGNTGSTAFRQFAAQQTSLPITAVMGGLIIRGVYGTTTSWAAA